MAPLLLVLHLSAMSELLSASSKPISTTQWHSFNPLENGFTKKSKKSLFVPTLIGNILRIRFNCIYSYNETSAGQAEWFPQNWDKQKFFRFCC